MCVIHDYLDPLGDRIRRKDAATDDARSPPRCPIQTPDANVAVSKKTGDPFLGRPYKQNSTILESILGPVLILGNP